ncbi:MAG: NADH-quinone oxidoreductase subunit NuoE [Alphaproteobacteria bacterium]
MSVRRLAETQPDSFAFSEDNRAWMAKEIAKYPEGRQASVVISLLWRAQEQEGWVSEPAIAAIAEMLDMPRIRVLEVATFYTMFHLAPVGTVAHVQVCGTTPCWLRGADDLKAVCRSRIHHDQHALSADGTLSWEEVECLGACVNAPMIQINADTYEDLTSESFAKILDDLLAGRPVQPGPQIDRILSAPMGGITTLTDVTSGEAAVRQETPEASPDEAPGAGTAAPAALSAPRDGVADDLQQISGVGPKIEVILNGLGVFHFDQIAAWSAQTVDWVDDNLKFKGRIARENWIEQTKTLAAGGETEFSRRTAPTDRE